MSGLSFPACRWGARATLGSPGSRLRWALPGLLAVWVLVACASPASAVIVRLGGGRALSYQPMRGAPQPLDALFTNVEYDGGPVMPSNTDYVIYWRPSTGPAYPADYEPGIDRYFEDLAHDSGGTGNVDSVAAQYNDAAGQHASYDSHFGGAKVDEDPYPANGCTRASICLTSAQIQTELKAFVQAEKLPADLSHEYFLLTPPGVESCFTAAGTECSAGSSKPKYCAYHTNLPVSGGGEIIYANDPYVTGNPGCDDGNHPNGTTSDGALIGGLSHEHNESITDPEPDSGWIDLGEGSEIGDKCHTSFGTPLGTASDGASYNQVINGHFYWYQEEWSNQSNQCLQRLAFAGEEPTASFTSAPESGNTVKLDASASTAPGGVFRYDWQFNDEGGSGTPLETTSAAISHTFSEAGLYHVALTVYAADGTSIGTAHTVAAGGVFPTAAFSVTTASPTVGVPVSFDGSASKANAGSITKYEWAFGDGTFGTGATPTHTYTAAGSYEATLTVTNSSSRPASVTHTVTVIVVPAAPTAVTASASPVRQETATLNATVKPNGSNVSECHFEYGPTAAYGSSAPCSSLPGAGNTPVGVSAALTGLSANTTYHYRVVAVNGVGSGYGRDATLETPPKPPTVLTGAAASLTSSSALLNAEVDPNGGTVSVCELEYGPTLAYGSAAPCTSLPGSGLSPVAVSGYAEGLTSNTTYHFRVVAANAGGTSYGADGVFTLSAALAPPGRQPQEPGANGSSPSSALPGSLPQQPGGGGSPPSPGRQAAQVPDAELASTSLKATRSGLVTVTITCPAGESSCAGTVALATVVPAAAKTAPRTRRRKTAVLRFAGGAFAVAGGHAVTMKLHLSAKARRMLASRHLLHALATVTAHDPAAATHTAKAVVIIRPAKAAHRKA